MQEKYPGKANNYGMNNICLLYAPRAKNKRRNGVALALAALAVFSLLPSAPAQTGQLSVNVGQPGAKINPLFYGLMTEEINHSYDGGLYAELVQNRSLDDSADAPVHWSLVTEGGGVGSIALDTNNPVPGTARTHCLRLTSTDVGGAARVGAANDGFWGIPVRPHTRYRMSLYAKAAPGFHGPLFIALQSTDGSRTYARATVPALSTQWKQYTLTLATTDALASTANRLAILTQGKGTVWLTQVSLFPPTFHNRPNGSRVDLMQTLTAMHPGFLRLPGGNYLEGNTLATRYPWKQTLGPLAQRPGHMGTWGYRSSDGLGLLEFLQWCEDMHAEPLLAVWAGYALDGEHINAGQALQPSVQDALDEIEYVTGSAQTPWGARRAQEGHPAPFPLHYVEIGNEDWFDKSGSYDGRFAQIADAIRARYPKLQIIATMPVQSRRPDLVDDHYYRSAAHMENDVHHYDAVPRTGPQIFVGEWATTEGSPTPNFHAALADAAWLTGLERNADIVALECYAPLLVNVSPSGSQWGTNLIGYNAAASFGSTSYYAQTLFAQNRGDVVLPVQITPAPIASAGQSAALPIPHGKVGVGTWVTQAEFRNVAVTHGAQTLYHTSFAQGDTEWALGQGQWQTKGGTLQQTGNLAGAVATVGSPAWTDYTLHLQARKLSGGEGFLILFHALSDSRRLVWNIGGWGNTRTSIQRDQDGDYAEIARSVPVTVQTGRWYDIRIVVQGPHIQCFLDGKLTSEAQDTPPPTPAPLYASAARQSRTGDILVKVVNISDTDQPLLIKLNGAGDVSPSATLITMTGPNAAVNTLDAPRRIAPVTAVLHGIGPQFRHTFPARSVSVLRISAQP